MPRQTSDSALPEQSLPPAFGEWLKRQRRLLDLTQDQLAKQVGCAHVTIRKIETGEMRPSRQMAELLAKALAIPAGEREIFVKFARGTQSLEEWKHREQNSPGVLHSHPPSVGQSDLPSGTITFLFTDIEGSANLWERFPGAMKTALARYQAILNDSITKHEGCIFQIVGDAFCAAFSSATAAAAAALAAQRAFLAESWGEIGPLRVRMGLHTGTAEVRDGDYQGTLTIARVRRLLSEAYGGQTLLSNATAGLLSGYLPEGVTVRDLGEVELKDFPHREHIHQLSAPDLPDNFPQIRLRAARPHNLPAAASAFVGRDGDLAELAQTFAQPGTRLLTLIGLGGIGKTRLALELAANHLAAFKHGAFFVPLGPLSTADAIVPTIAESLGFKFYAGPEPRQQLLDYLREKQLLLVMDNCEHLVDHLAIFSEILGAAPQVRVIATSRERLKLQEEQVYSVQGLDFPDWETAADVLANDAVRLFLQSARRAASQFVLQQNDLVYLARICHMVRGMPLGIELAAGWAEMLSLEEIAAEISRSADFLETELRNVPERQRSIRAAFNSSWKLLADAERELFAQLSVFRGGFTREAAQAIGGATLRSLTALVNKSLVARTPAGRYEIHELLRQYAEEKLGQDPPQREASVRERHSAFYLDWLAAQEPELKGSRQIAVLAEMDREIENARMAWAWAIANQSGNRLAQAQEGLALFYLYRGRFSEGATAARNLAGLQGEAACEAKALAWQGAFEFTLGRRAAARKLLEDSLNMLETSSASDRDVARTRAFAKLQLGHVLERNGERDEAKQLMADSLAGYEEADDIWGQGDAQQRLGYLLWNAGQYAESKRRFEASIAIRQSLHDQRGVADVLHGLAMLAEFLGNFEDALRANQDALALFAELNAPDGIGKVLAELVVCQAFNGRLDGGIEALTRALTLFSGIGHRTLFAHWQCIVAWIYWLQGEYAQTQRWAEKAVVTSREVGYQRGVALSLNYLGQAHLLSGNRAKAVEYLRQGAAIFRQIRQPAELPLVLAALAAALRAIGEVEEAQAIVREGLQVAVGTQSWYAWLPAVAAAALLLLDRQGVERAVAAYALVRRHPFAQHKGFDDIYGQTIDRAAAQLAPAVVAASLARGQVRDLKTAVQQLLIEFSHG